MYEYGTLKLVKIILRRSVGEKRIIEEINQKQGYSICIYGNFTMKFPV
jgi:hypothetical protein